MTDVPGRRRPVETATDLTDDSTADATSIVHGAVLPRVTAAPGAALFPTAARTSDSTALATSTERVPAAMPAASPAPAPRHAGKARSRTGLVVLGGVAVAAVAVPVVVLALPDGHGKDRTAPVARPGNEARPSAAPTTGGPTGAASTPRPSATTTGHRSAGKGAAGAPAGTPSAAGPQLFSVVAGPGCTSSGAYDRIGFYTDGKQGWLAGSGGYTGAGCDGRFDAMPMSGSAAKDDPSLYARWTFDPGTRHDCAVAVFTPADGSKVYVGGSPARFSVHRQQGGTGIAGFSVDQPHNLGRWADGPSFTADGPFYVRLDNTGQDWTGDQKTYAHVAAAQVRATCR